MSHLLITDRGSLSIARAAVDHWRVEYSSGTLDVKGILSWNQSRRTWKLRRFNAREPLNQWPDSDGPDRPADVPGWVINQILRHFEIQLFAAQRRREAALSELVRDLAAQVRADRDTFAECMALLDPALLDRATDPPGAEVLARCDELLRRADALLAPGGQS